MKQPTLAQKCYIYGLVDPRTGKIRYVGKSVDPAYRFQRHIRYELRGESHKVHWIKQLVAVGLTPELTVLEEVKDSLWQESECFWIAKLNKDGGLTNETLGGDGQSKGFKHRPSAIEKLRKARLGKRASAESRRRMSLAQRNKPKEVIEKNTESLKRYYQNHPEVFAVMSARQKARFRDTPVSPETRRKMSKAARRKAPPSEETKRKTAEAVKNYYRTHPRSTATRSKMSEARRRYFLTHVVSKESRQKMSLAKRGNLNAVKTVL